MPGAAVTVQFEFPDLLRAVENARPRIEHAIVSTIQTQVGLRFDAEGAHNGHVRWADLKMRQGMILSLTGKLRNSISPPGAPGSPGPEGYIQQTGSLTDLLTVVGTKVLYASVHDLGAKIRPKNKQSLAFLNPGTGKMVFAKEVTIPARPFTDLNQQDYDELSVTLEAVIVDILDKAT